jgi:hypothetical protein
LNIEINKTKEEGEKRERKRKRKRENQGKLQGEMVHDQTANQTAKLLMEGQKKKKSLGQAQWNFSLSCSVVTPLASRPVCLCLLGRFRALLWWVAGGWGPMVLLVEVCD